MLVFKQRHFFWLVLVAVLAAGGYVYKSTVGLDKKVKVVPIETPAVYEVTYNEEFFHFPVIAVAKQITYIAEQDGGGMAYGGSWEVEGTVSQVMKWYVNALADAGWSTVSTPADPNDESFQVFEGIKGDRQMTLTVLKQGNANKVKIMVDLPFMSSAEKEYE
ncbi:hypothetical protein A3E17_01860 [Candidatus Amesbacteria bacterium RIFCSPHIGHO2_12_FULL_48_14]|mgnify:CR=1 FL=1|uniref:Uncharacterized protein n=2 Tax=Candidatus Amesiibacteriota TaxID=1752730 RepID=A0A1F4ZCD1_9BACT|nr:MAG: hypothetical protein UY22_C0014G0006 [Candidatus Amesbacteria bacterium GW2011_GWC1_48_10]OGC90929.1 MAG: hypothetical protein A2V48_02135 [Candidatus Amesbacteria bacterium RBG_19FT_COMBO_48_16]OGC97380.1 MAG: hypothetical protein A2W16_00695 [Candidatus Amesbacteria bacterium RBG_16_48_31]OGD00434.1 MAG: hypothetical protein A2702_03650 [Candidatus Amesbacteria bacterium RIFCSPHIGHO2_01_FULL_48_75]OGD03963.1 MAG: hypothetical protein A3E17_01860 [Candidatus Amesbacteria bacterium RIFC